MKNVVANKSICYKKNSFFLLVSAWQARFDTLNCRLNMYRRFFVSQRKEISTLKKTIKRLKQQIREYDDLVIAQDDFLFGML